MTSFQKNDIACQQENFQQYKCDVTV